jgi:hypothetical protein
MDDGLNSFIYMTSDEGGRCALAKVLTDFETGDYFNE